MVFSNLVLVKDFTLLLLASCFAKPFSLRMHIVGRYNDRIRHGTQQTRLSNSTNFKGVKAALLFFPFFFSAQGTINPKWSGPWFAAILRRTTRPSSLANGSFSTSNVRSERSFLVSVCNKTLEAVTTNIREQNLLGHILLENKEL